jgi:2'-5' RNA ligase
MRLFVGLELPKDIKDRLQLTFGGIERAKWQTPEQMHLTLRFIGEVSDHQAADINAALGLVPFSPFDLMINNTDYFGPGKRPRLLWAGISGDAEVKQLADRINRALLTVGIPLEEHKYTPHITLARLKQIHADQLGPYLEHNAGLSSPPFHISNFSLFQSHLGHSGASYRVLSRYPIESAYNDPEDNISEGPAA